MRLHWHSEIGAVPFLVFTEIAIGCGSSPAAPVADRPCTPVHDDRTPSIAATDAGGPWLPFNGRLAGCAETCTLVEPSGRSIKLDPTDVRLDSGAISVRRGTVARGTSVGTAVSWYTGTAPAATCSTTNSNPCSCRNCVGLVSFCCDSKQLVDTCLGMVDCPNTPAPTITPPSSLTASVAPGTPSLAHGAAAAAAPAAPPAEAVPLPAAK
jgi:hypothetical protein